MGSTLVMNFDCQHAAANACVKHLRFHFTSDKPLKINSIQDFRNTAEWDGIWNNQFNRGLTTEVAPPDLFKLPLLEKK